MRLLSFFSRIFCFSPTQSSRYSIRGRLCPQIDSQTLTGLAKTSVKYGHSNSAALFDPLGDRHSSQGMKSRHPNRSSRTVLGVRTHLPGDEVISGATRASERHLRPQAVASNHRDKGLCSLGLKYKASTFNLNGCTVWLE
ncbi:hypothetical protein B0H14DRAFT_1584473 [Mycena olivaceomarginata]|nr:hypothetical protein B0H14DRAFT_1584473 [Mycena olivaceomarginata]